MTSKKFDYVCLRKEEAPASLSPWVNFAENMYAGNSEMVMSSLFIENKDDVDFAMNFALPKKSGMKFG